MGHSEMLLAVAGIEDAEKQQRLKNLASGDWSDFTPSERLALRFASRITTDPAKLTSTDLNQLVQTFGPHRAVDLIWRSAWCNYMTRVADACQLPLEQTNVFAPPRKETPAKKSDAK